MNNVQSERTKVVMVTTVPITLGFFRGHIAYLKNKGFDVQAVSSPAESLTQFAKEQGIHIYGILMARRPSPFTDLMSLWQLWRFFSMAKPDIVHSHTPKAGFLGTIAARVAGIKVVFLSIFGLPQMTMSGFAKKLLDLVTRLSCSIADCVWFDSCSMREYAVANRLCSASKAVVFGQGSVAGIDTTGAFSPEIFGPSDRACLRGKYKIPPDALVLGFVGRIVSDKGLHELVCAWKTLRSEYPNLYLLLVGPFEKGDPLLPQDEAAIRSDPRVRLTGFVLDTAPLYAIMDIFVLPSYREGFGLANIEAAAMQLPVVSTRIPGCVDSVQDGVTGTLIPPRAPAALTGAIRKYLDNESLRSEHGFAGRARVIRDFRPETIWQALYQEYTRVLRERRLPIPERTSDG